VLFHAEDQGESLGALLALIIITGHLIFLLFLLNPPPPFDEGRIDSEALQKRAVDI
jgi:hypothetical protein